MFWRMGVRMLATRMRSSLLGCPAMGRKLAWAAAKAAVRVSGVMLG